MRDKFHKSQVRNQKSEIRSQIVIFYLLLATCYLLLATFCQAQPEERFIYDSQGKRDPFVPLLDKDSATGIRTVFSPPEDEQAKLPLEIAVKGILWNAQEYFAIINDHVVKKGDNLGAVKIKEIEKNKVTLEYDEREFSIFLNKEKEK